MYKWESFSTPPSRIELCSAITILSMQEGYVF